MSRRVRCIMCGKEFDVTQDDTILLLEHIQKFHPNTALSNSDLDLLSSKETKETEIMEVNNNDNEMTEKYVPHKTAMKPRIYKESPNKENYIIEDKKNLSDRQSIRDTFLSAHDCREIERRVPIGSNDHSSIKDYPDNESNRKNRRSIDKKSAEIFVGSQFSRECRKENVPQMKLDNSTAGSTTEILYKRRYKIQTQVLQRSPKISYKTSVKRWRPGSGTIVCPKCGANKRPIIKAHSDRVSYSPLGAACILTCWPFCFLPCLFPPPAREYLHCAVCNHFLGIYDRKAETIQPNEENLEEKSSGVCPIPEERSKKKKTKK